MHSDLESILELESAITKIMIAFPNGEMYGEVLNVVLKAFESRFGFFGFINRAGDLVCPSMTREIWVQCKVPDKDIIFPHDCWSGIWGRAMREQRVLYNNSSGETPDGHIPVERVIAVPLVHLGELVGCIAIANKDIDYTEQDAIVLEGVCQRLSPLLHARLTRDTAIDDLKISEANYRSLLNLVPTIIVSLDHKGHIVLLNSFGRKILRCNDTCLGLNWFDNFIRKSEREKLKRVFNGLMSGGTGDYTEVENVILTTQGEERAVYWKNQAIRSDSGDIIGTLSAGDDITEQRTAEKLLKQRWKVEEEVFKKELNKLSLLTYKGR